MTRARYDYSPLSGYIRVSKIVGDKPIEFRMTLYKSGLGVLEDRFYPNFETALAHSCNYGFIPSQWVQTEDK